MSTEVATKSEAQLPAGLMNEMEADAAIHGQTFGADMLIIPRLTILQDLSPQIKETKAEYVPGAKPGLILNTVTNTLDTKITFVPSKFFVRYIAWQENRGGLVDQSLTLEEVEENFEENGLGMWTGSIVPRGKDKAVPVDVVQTPEWVGVAMGEGWGPMPVAISLAITKSKAARKINTAIDLYEIQGKKGPFKPPAFYHRFELSTAIETSGNNEWFGLVVNHLGIVQDDKAQLHMMHKAKELREAFEEGTAEVAEEGAER